MDYKVELVAHALFEAQQGACPWNNQSAVCKEQFREFARNAMKLLNEDIGVLLLVLEQSTVEKRGGRTRAAA